MKWLALFSQTGWELNNIIHETGRKPDMALTNRVGPSAIDDIVPITYIPKKPNIFVYDYYFRNYDIITLHGYLRILPPEVCGHLIYNGHPAAIHLYPELKGKDKQEDVFLNKDLYSRMGTVIHRVSHELDSGEIIAFCDVENDTTSIEDAYEKLAKLSVAQWVVFVKNIPTMGVPA